MTSPGIEIRPKPRRPPLGLRALSPHMKFIELNKRGYVLVDIDRERAAVGVVARADHPRAHETCNHWPHGSRARAARIICKSASTSLAANAEAAELAPDGRIARTDGSGREVKTGRPPGRGSRCYRRSRRSLRMTRGVHCMPRPDRASAIGVRTSAARCTCARAVSPVPQSRQDRYSIDQCRLAPDNVCGGRCVTRVVHEPSGISTRSTQPPALVAALHTARPAVLCACNADASR